MFSFYRENVGANMPLLKKFQSKASTNYAIGDALILNGGVLEKAAPTKRPDYICAENYVAPATNEGFIAVYPVENSQEWITSFGVDGTTVTVGTKVTLHSDSAQITATSTNGVAKVVAKLGTGEIGTEALVQFN